MNKRQLEVLKVSTADEKKVISLLERVYKKASEDCEKKIAELAARTDLQNIQSIVYQQQYQQAMKKQLDGILDTLHSESFEGIADYLGKCYENGFYGTLYDLHGQGCPVMFPIDQRQVVKALQTDAKLSKGMYSRLGEDVNYLKKSVRAELSRGISQGSTWVEMASRISKGMNSPFKTAMYNSMRIARTEGHRIQNQAQFDTLNAAKEKGADIVKQWDSTLDDRTRVSHQILNGQIRELDEYFEVNGHKAKYPGGFGRPEEDIHCRCTMLQRARWALDEDELKELEDRAAFFELDKSKDFEDFKNKYLQLPSNADTIDIRKLSDILEGCTTISEVNKAAQTYFQGKSGCKITEVKLSNIDVQAAKEIVLKVDDLDDRFESSLTTLKAKSMSPDLGGVCTPSNQSAMEYWITGNPEDLKSTIELNNKWLSSQSVISSDYEQNLKSPYTVITEKKDATISPVVHEYGHSILLGKVNEIYIANGGSNSTFTEAKQIYEQYMQDLRSKKQEIQKVQLQYAGQPNGLVKGNRAAASLQAEYDALQISKYSTVSVGEFIAESFCDAELNGENAREYSKKVMELLKKERGKSK